MIQIQKPNVLFFKTIGKQKPTSDTEYRLLAYSLIQNVEGGVLIYNFLSCELLFLKISEVADLTNNEYLREHWFVVPKTFDDKRFVNQYRSVLNLLSPKKNIISNYTILTTTDCNARCFYCYEKGRSRLPMSIETADKLTDYIIDNYNHDQSDNKLVSILWFGGEPLYNNEIITHISRRLRESGVKFKSRMISNGYLFDDELIALAANLWNLKQVQITLDGTEKIYNRAKAYIHKGVNAYERVLNNIDKLLKSKISVKVRMNVDLYNVDDLCDLADILYNRYGNCKGFVCYTNPLFEAAGDKPRERTDENRTKVYDKLRVLDSKLVHYGFKGYPPLPKEIRTNMCMADSGTSIVATPIGGIGLCEHFSESEFMSHINSLDNIDQSVVKSFNETCSDLDICDDCPIYPQCRRLKKCLEHSVCFAQKKEYKIFAIQQSMLQAYQKWQNNHSEVNIGVDNVSDAIEEIDTNC